ncbi:hypothetical protein [Novosphingobium sp. 9]|uniref:hypothetical protein n=1 Tax=Novosphingobium sp. 9 TaxID=2025349 RepID=UPI0021B56E3C|nr:hypothetical protein [Novosphingobium sp. 9]
MSKTASSRLTRVALLAGLAATITTIPVAAQAQRGRWGGGWGAGGWNDPWGYNGWGAGPFDSPGIPTRSFDPREGKISVSRFLASPDAAQELGHGMATIASDAAKDGAGGESDSANLVAQDDRQTFEAAVIDSLVGAGYDTTHPHADTGQSVEVRVSRHELALPSRRRTRSAAAPRWA